MEAGYKKPSLASAVYFMNCFDFSLRGIMDESIVLVALCTRPPGGHGETNLFSNALKISNNESIRCEWSEQLTLPNIYKYKL